MRYSDAAVATSTNNIMTMTNTSTAIPTSVTTSIFC